MIELSDLISFSNAVAKSLEIRILSPMMLTLEVLPREKGESTDTLRTRGAVPAVFYGPKEESTAVAIDARKLESTWKAAGETTIITLRGIGGDKETLIKDVQFHPVNGRILHVDFYVIEKGKKVEIAVPLHFVGEAPAEKAGHVLVKALHEIEMAVAPSELPHSLDIDISKLENVGDHISVGDIKVPPSAEVKTSLEEIVVSVTEFKEEKEEAPAPVEGAVEGEAAAPAEGAIPPPAEGEAKTE